MFAPLDDLNERQREGVTHDEGPLLIVAAAGTGKTRTLTARVARLVATDVRAQRILLLTVTRRAALEMLARAKGLVGPAARRARGGTFHAGLNPLLPHYGAP